MRDISRKTANFVFKIRQPSSEQEFKRYFHLRWKILRAPWNQAEGSEIDAIEDQCFHLMATDADDAVIGVARLQYNSDTEAQIRYMAIEPSHERKGIGRALIDQLEAHAKAQHCQIITLHAREPAVGFYLKLGFTLIEKSYLLFDELQHYSMLKKSD